MLLNLHSDHILRNLRRPGESGYKIPRGEVFTFALFQLSRTFRRSLRVCVRRELHSGDRRVVGLCALSTVVARMGVLY